ncbi:MAG: hypothetical protein ACRBB6_04505 [Neptuniibacter sp.]
MFKATNSLIIFFGFAFTSTYLMEHFIQWNDRWLLMSYGVGTYLAGTWLSNWYYGPTLPKKTPNEQAYIKQIQRLQWVAAEQCEINRGLITQNEELIQALKKHEENSTH